jgi:Zn-dependent peptidase ImmA (M78 family)
MAYLSRNNIDNLAEQILCDFIKAEYPKGHICYNIDPTRLAQFYGYNILYVTITREGSILGQTSTGKMWTSVIDSDGNDILFYLDGKTILIDSRLNTPKCYGRRNFTIAHELAHQFINRDYPEVYGPQARVICDYRRSSEPHKEITDWREWQADAMAAALLLPKQAIEEAMFYFGLGERIKVLSKKYSQYKYERFCEMADFLQVSKTALAYRLEQLGLLERNYLIREAQQRRGVA